MTDATQTNGNGNGRKPLVLDRAVLVPVGVVALAVTAVFGALHYFDSQLVQPLRELQSDVKDIRAAMVDRWTGTNMKMWELEMRRRNPELDMPNTWDIVNGQRNDR